MEMIKISDSGGHDVSAEARELATLDYPFHAASAGLLADLHRVLLDFGYVWLKLSKTEPEALIADIDRALTLNQGDCENANANKRALALLRDAINMSAQVIVSDAAQIPGQLLGRLLKSRCPELAPMLKSASEWKRGTWIRPRTGSLFSAGGPLVRVLSGAGRWPQSLLIRPDGSEVFAMSTDGAFRIWDAHSGVLVREIDSQYKSDPHMKITADDQGLVTAFSRGLVTFRDTRDGRLLGMVTIPKGRIAPVVTPDRRFIVVAAEDRTMRVCDGRSGRQIRKVYLHKGRVTAMIALRDSRRIVSGSEDGRIMVWELSTGRNLASLGGHTGSITVLACGWCDNEVVSASRDRTVRLWDIATRRDFLSLSPLEPVVALGLAQNLRRVVMACDDGSLGVWDTGLGKDSWISSGDRDPDLAISADGRLAVTTAGESVRLWDVNQIKPALIGDLDSWQFLKLLNKVTGTRLQLMNIKRVEAMSIDKDGEEALTGTYDGDIHRWSLERGQKILCC